MTEKLSLTPAPIDNSRINELCTLYTHHLTDLGNHLHYIPSHSWYTFTDTLMWFPRATIKMIKD